MSAISLKSITGITSITTPAGVDNQLTLHNNNTTEAVKLDIAGNLHFHNHLNITGVTTAAGNIIANDKIGIGIANPTHTLEVNGSVKANAQIKGYSGNHVVPSFTFFNAASTGMYLLNSNGTIGFSNAGTHTATLDNNGKLSLLRDLDVDGHTELDNVNIAGVATFSQGGSEVVRINSGGLLLYNDLSFFGASTHAYWDHSANQFKLNDNTKLSVGSSSDLQIFHDGTANNNVISGHLNSLNIRNYDTNSTDINLSTRNDILLQTAINESAIWCDANSGVHIYYNGAQKFVTTNTGATVTGTLVATGADINGDLDVDGHTNLDNVSIAGITTFTNGYFDLKPNGGGNAHFRILSTGTGDAGIFFDAANGDISGSDYVFIGQQNNLDFVINANVNAGNIDFQRAGNTQVRITSAGTFGVGTVDPDSNYKIDCNGVMRIGDGNAGKRIQFSRSGLGDELVLGVDGYGSNFSANDAVIQSSPTFGRPLIFGTNNQERLRIASDGTTTFGNNTNNGTYVTIDAITNNGRVRIGAPNQAVAKGKVIIDNADRNAMSDITNPDNYGVVLCGSPTSGHGNGITFCNDNAQNAGAGIVHVDEGSNNLGSLRFYTKDEGQVPYETLRMGKYGNLVTSTASWRSASEKYVDTLHMPQAHEGYHASSSYSGLSVAAEMWHQSHVRGTSHLTTELFSTRMGHNAGMFIYVEVWFSCAVSNYQGYQALWANANRTGSNNFTINNTGQEGNQLGTDTGNYFNLTYASAGSAGNQRLTWKVTTSFGNNYTRVLYKSTVIGHDYFVDLTTIR